MSANTTPISRDTARTRMVVRRERASGARPADRARSARWHQLLVGLFLAAAVTSPIGFADTTPGRMLLPIEVLGADGTTVSRTVALQAAQAGLVRSLWLQVHGLRYAGQASVQINTSPWIPL